MRKKPLLIVVKNSTLLHDRIYGLIDIGSVGCKKVGEYKLLRMKPVLSYI